MENYLTGGCRNSRNLGLRNHICNCPERLPIIAEYFSTFSEAISRIIRKDSPTGSQVSTVIYSSLHLSSIQSSEATRVSQF